MTPELSRPYAINHVGTGAMVTVEANPTERAAVAARMGLQSIKRLICRFDLRPADGAALLAHGKLRARVVQTCVLSLDNFETEVEEDFVVRFVPAGTESEDIDLDGEDEIPYDGVTIELGEATAEQLALALDPFPRKPGATQPDIEQTPSGPFAALAKLRRDQ